MTEDELQQIEERCNAAPPGPYVHMDFTDDGYYVATPDGCVFATGLSESLAEFIAHARQDVPALIAEVRRLRCAVKMLKDNENIMAEMLRRSEAQIWRLTHKQP